MDKTLERFIKETCKAVGNDRTRLMDVARAVQAECGCVCGEALDLVARELGLHRVEVESLVSFYAFLSGAAKGRTVIRLCKDIIDELNGLDRVVAAFEQELGIKVGETTADGKVTLEYSPCIGMSDQAPAALINEIVVTNLDTDRARTIARLVRQKGATPELVRTLGDGNNAHPLVRADGDEQHPPEAAGDLRPLRAGIGPAQGRWP
jgi:[NiFe] hydrogenase diaphorase moiety large subunit